MLDSQTVAIARRTARISPWFFCGAVLVGLITCFYGFAPISYLSTCVGLAIAWFGLAVLAFRRRSEWLRIVGLMFAILGQQIVWRYLGGGHHFEIFQGGSVVIAVFSALMMMLHDWFYKFSK